MKKFFEMENPNVILIKKYLKYKVSYQNTSFFKYTISTYWCEIRRIFKWRIGL